MKRWIFLICFCFISSSALAAKPNLFLLKNYHEHANINGWVMSEKLDGIRAFWDGEKLISRGGKTLTPPAWFTRHFPPFPIDGELWTKRSDFETISSIVNSRQANERWQQISYQIFDVPNQPGGLLKRLHVLERYLQHHPTPYIHILKQTAINNRQHLLDFLDTVTQQYGEGVVARDPIQHYQTGRLSSALKLKKHSDTECTVIKILPGKGKYQGKMGAVRCRTAEGKELKIGSGFTDAQRALPPKLGSQITFKYYGLTKKGNHRFPIYLRPFSRIPWWNQSDRLSMLAYNRSQYNTGCHHA